jgi:hypothetical protein
MSDRTEERRDDGRSFLLVLAGALLMVALAYGAGALLGVSPHGRLAISFLDIVLGAAAAGPLVLLLMWFMRTDIPVLVRFRHSQLEFFAKIGFEFTPLRIALLAVGAGVSEELLFRGVFQTWIEGGAPLVLAIVLPNILFGALHARTSLYAFIAGLVGVYMGVLFAATGNVMAPIITHALYDWVALWITRRAIEARARA